MVVVDILSAHEETYLEQLVQKDRWCRLALERNESAQEENTSTEFFAVCPCPDSAVLVSTTALNNQMVQWRSSGVSATRCFVLWLTWRLGLCTSAEWTGRHLVPKGTSRATSSS